MRKKRTFTLSRSAHAIVDALVANSGSPSRWVCALIESEDAKIREATITLVEWSRSELAVAMDALNGPVFTVMDALKREPPSRQLFKKHEVAAGGWEWRVSNTTPKELKALEVLAFSYWNGNGQVHQLIDLQ